MAGQHKISLVGEANAGKTTLAYYMTHDKFLSNSSSTVGAAFNPITHGNKKFQLWDTSGQEKFASLGPIYYRNSDVILIVFDSNNYRFELKLKFYLDEIKTKMNDTNIYKLIIVCNKIDLISSSRLNDLKKRIKEIVSLSLASDNVFDYVEISCKNKTGRDILMTAISNACDDVTNKKTQIEKEYSLNDNIIRLDGLNKVDKLSNTNSSCCLIS